MAGRREAVSSRVSFVLEGEEREVSLRAPGAVRRGGVLVVQLLDLWVATLLPGDVIDLTFEVLTAGPGGTSVRSSPLDGLDFARGYVALGTRRLGWDGSREGVPHGAILQSILVHPPPATLPGRPIDAILARILPHTVRRYPPVALRSVPG